MLRQIKYFIAVVDCQSFTEAAEQCFISQSAISQQISALERDLGVELMKRIGRKFTLTPAGEYLYLHGRDLLQTAESLRRETIRVGLDVEPPLRIGYLDGYEGKEMQETIFEFAAQHPDVVLNVVKLSHEELFHGISQNELDLVFSYQRRAFSDEYENCHLRYVPCLIELSVRHPLAQGDDVTLDQLRELPCILIAKKEQRDIEQDFYHRVLGIGSKYIFVDSYDDARLSVLGNRGYLPVPGVGRSADASIAIRQLPIRPQEHPVQFNFCAFWKKANHRSSIREFVSIFHDKFAQES